MEDKVREHRKLRKEKKNIKKAGGGAAEIKKVKKKIRKLWEE